MSGAINAPLSEEPRFVCRREGHIPQVKFTSMKASGVDPPTTYFANCLRCGKWLEFKVGEDGEIVGEAS